MLCGVTVMLSLVWKLQANSLQCSVSLGCTVLGTRNREMEFLGEENDSGPSWSPMMWVIGVEQVLPQHNQLLDGESGLPTMEMSYWHPLSSLNMCWRWRALDLSWQFHCSHNSLMAPLAESYPSILLQTFVIGITLLICFPSFCSKTRFKILLS